APLVDPLVHGEPPEATGGAQELPRTDRGGDRLRVHVEAALHEYQVHEIGRQPFALQALAEESHVTAGALEPALERGAAGAGEELDVTMDVSVDLRSQVLDRRGVEDLGVRAAVVGR